MITNSWGYPMKRGATFDNSQAVDTQWVIYHDIRDRHHQIQRALGLTLGQMLDVGDLLNQAQRHGML